MSLDKTGEGAGVSRQERECRELAARKGLTVVGIRSDNDTSATSGAARPEFDALLADLAAGRADVIIAWHQDRLLRLTRDLERVIALDVPVLTVTAGTLDLSNPARRAAARTVAAWSQYETEQKATRQVAANAQDAAAGKPYWRRRPAGLNLDGTEHPAEAEAIRWAAEAVLSGETLAAVAREFAARGLVTYTGKQWTTVQIRRLLLNERLAGLRTYNGSTVTGTWAPVLSETTWQAVTAILRAPARGTGNPSGRAPETLLGGIATCGLCGKPVHGARVDKVPYYKCQGADLYRLFGFRRGGACVGGCPMRPGELVAGSG